MNSWQLGKFLPPELVYRTVKTRPGIIKLGFLVSIFLDRLVILAPKKGMYG